MPKSKNKINVEDSKSKNMLIGIIVCIVIAWILTAGFLVFYFNQKIDKEYSKNPDREWLIDNCKCVEYNGIPHCFEGFELVKGFCRNGSYITNRLISCSKYKCPEYFVDFNETI